MIEFSHIYKTYPGPAHALRDVTFQIAKGEFAFLTGPSGAGKTTMFKIISAFDRPNSGAVKIAGYDLAEITTKELPYFRRKIGVIYQDFRLLKKRTVLENVSLPLEIGNEKPQVMTEKARSLLDKVGLFHKMDRFPAQLSGGEQQRVAIARALIHKPGVLIADEPTGNLDPDLSREIMDLLDQVNAQGTTVFVATHDHDLVKSFSRRTIEINEGQLVRD